jgi:hypothetical protein
MSACRSCGAPIRWVITVNDKRMPVDDEPVPDGNVLLDGDRATVIDPGQLLLDDPPRFVSHFATCPNADHHRRNH